LNEYPYSYFNLFFIAVIRGRDPFDATSLPKPFPIEEITSHLEQMVIGIPEVSHNYLFSVSIYLDHLGI
jgi:hypothetical protein